MRSLIRNSTGKDCRLSQACDIAFVMGRLIHEGASAAAVGQQEAALRLEQETFQDVLKEDFLDSYNNLTLKSLFSLKYFNKLPKREEELGRNGRTAGWQAC